MPSPVVLQTSLPGLPVRRGKVRDVYDLGEQLLLVSTDRLSAFDWVLPTGIPDKGRVLTQISAFWFDRLGGANHLHHDRRGQDAAARRRRSPARWRAARRSAARRGSCRSSASSAAISPAPAGRSIAPAGRSAASGFPRACQESSRLPEPIFTPATKAETGHDENITFEQMAAAVGRELSEELRRRSIDIFQRGAEYARERGIIIADTKFEFGQVDGKILLIDEVLTPDSSRFWPADQYAPGRGQPSFDKQFVRDWLTASGWDKNSPPPALPDDVVQKTRAKYVEAYEQLTGRRFE